MENPRQWRQFWSSFNAAVHTQAIPEIQKLNYLYSCLKGKALQAISGYDIAPENYEVIRKLLNEKYGDHSIVTTLLYNELQSIKRNEREWIGTIENIERIRNCQHSLTQLNIKSTTTKPEQKQRYNPGGTSALSTIKDNQNTSKITTTKRRPCVFCNQDHWDSDCVNYTTLNARLSRLKVLKKCTICLRDSHKGQNCNVKKQCFYCKSSHNSALCNKRNSLSLNNTMSQRNEEHERIGPSKRKDCSTSLYNSTLTTRSKQTKETLLLCKEIKVFNPSQPQLQQNTLALFDIGSQLSFISKKLSRQLKLTETETQIMRIAPFGMKEPKSCPTARIQLNVLTTESEIIQLQANIIDYLTNELQVVETSNEFQIQNLTNYWKKPDVLIGADYFFKFINLREIRELKSGHMLVQSKVGPMIAGSGDIKKLCKNELYPKEVVYSTNVNISTELEKFWKLETIGIQESPQDDDDGSSFKAFQTDHHPSRVWKISVCWPWKDSTKISNNYGLCLGRLKNLINRLQHNSNLHSYHQILYGSTTLRFVQNRIEEIRKSNFELNYIPSDQNPADIATKGVSPLKLQNCKQWWKGPRWLELKKSEWPKCKLRYSGNDEFAEAIALNLTKMTQTFKRNIIEFIDVCRFSSWTKLVRVTVWTFRFIKQTCKKKLVWLEPLSVKKNYMTKVDYDIAETMLIRQAQSQMLTEEEKEKWNLYLDEGERITNTSIIIWNSNDTTNHCLYRRTGRFKAAKYNNHFRHRL
ncbi:Uncharacterized protein BM_BM17149 [Brugia malayi]|uniref:DUF1758 domain-containing protein n=1 Tax=Brugia malayi TaxID=6279 RepID=A0A4E9G3L0_BRUMA|nr:Uncharacterized protein BM_BM17149 [Brugia malayi]VIP00155.1 Uncharacterized protein BM_BM17149 [Brugia malayi]